VSRLATTPVNHPALASAPTVPTLRAGDVYYDTTAGSLYVYSGSAWSAVGASSTITALDAGAADSIAPYAGGRASTTSTQTINGGTA